MPQVKFIKKIIFSDLGINFICKKLSFILKLSSMTPDQIKKWLKESGKDRQWLAEKCGAKKSTVDGWLSNKPIPKSALNAITSLMQASESFNPKLTLDQFSKIQQRAKAEGVSVEEWITKAIVGALLMVVMMHLMRSPSDWSPGSMLATGKAGLELVRGLL